MFSSTFLPETFIQQKLRPVDVKVDMLTLHVFRKQLSKSILFALTIWWTTRVDTSSEDKRYLSINYLTKSMYKKESYRQLLFNCYNFI